MPKIYLSPSNQYANAYATGNTTEMIQCDKIANATAAALKRCGFDVKVGKSGDSMANRVAESNAFKADIHLPIHTNAYNGKVTGGTLVMVHRSTDKHKKVGQAVLNAVGAISPGKDYALQVRQDLYELNTPNALSVYLEVEFHDTKEGSDWIRNNITNIGEAIAKGLCNAYGMSYKASSGVTQSTATTTTATATAKAETCIITMAYTGKGYTSTKGQVLTIQRILNELKDGSGYRGKDGKKLTLDGVFGDNTEYALKAFQAAHKLTVDGICGKDTWSTLLCEYKK